MNRRAFLLASTALCLPSPGWAGKEAGSPLAFAYCWNSALTAWEPETLALRLREARIGTALVASGGSSARLYPGHAAALRQSGIRVAGVIANNEYVFPGREPDLRAGVIAASAHGEEIHLDVEPHALSDFRDQRSWYVSRLARIAAVARAASGKLVSVAVPYWYTADEVEEISANCDVMHLMAYGTTGTASKAERVAGLVARIGQRVVLTLRASDFTSRAGLLAHGRKIAPAAVPLSVHEMLTYYTARQSIIGSLKDKRSREDSV